ncbi:MAG TPA: hypothetical protein VJ023_01790 [Pyrinomonadaceae bacterium]|nr:hypothetical protein [Pyrinomonadaceae bacterium]
MTILDLLILLVVAGICGSLGQAISGYSRALGIQSGGATLAHS